MNMSHPTERHAMADRGRLRRTGGFTLIELLVTIAIAAILLALAAPSFEESIVSSRTSDIATKVAVTASTARGEAIKRNGRVVMCMSADGSSCTTSGSWEQGWILFHDRNQNGTRDSNSDPNLDDTLVLKESAVIEGYKIIEAATKTSLNFPFTVCRATPTVATRQRQVLVSPTGKGSVSKITGSTCA